MADNQDKKPGYGNPPLHSRFKRGQSGNPRGRRKGTLNLKTVLTEELSEPIHVREGDKVRSISKQRALLKTLMAKALKGDTRSAGLLITLMVRLIEPDLPRELDDDLSAGDQEIIADFLKRHSTNVQGSPPLSPNASATQPPNNTEIVETNDDKR